MYSLRNRQNTLSFKSKNEYDFYSGEIVHCNTSNLISDHTHYLKTMLTNENRLYRFKLHFLNILLSNHCKNHYNFLSRDLKSRFMHNIKIANDVIRLNRMTVEHFHWCVCKFKQGHR